MNRNIIRSIFAAVAVAATGAWAETETVNGITWYYNVTEGNASLCAPPSSTAGSLTIPSTLGGYPVTSIGVQAFYCCSGLTSIRIPSSVTSIEYGAFTDCSGLAVVIIPNSVTNIGAGAFCDCGLTDVIIGNGVTSIGDNAFCYCSGLTSVAIPDSVTSIGGYAFCSCGLTSVTIGNGVTSIGEETFSYCHGLTSVTIPENVTSIGRNAFCYCSGLTSVTIPDSVTSIGSGAFDKTPFYNNKPDGLVVLGKVAYKMKGSCPASVTIPDGVTSIESAAFRYCHGLTSVTIPDSVTSIGYEAFYGCSGLTSVHISDLAAWCGISFGSDANPLYYAKNLYLNGSLVTDLTIPSSVTNIRSSAFYGCSGLTNVVIGSGVTSIGDYAFYGCSGLTSVTIPSSVTSIGDCAFYGCSGLTSVTIPDSVTNIEGWAFYGCSGLTSVTIPGNVKYIGRRSFYNCTNLTDIVFEGNAPTLGSDVFLGVPSDCVVYVYPSSLGWGVSIPGTWNGLAIRYIEPDSSVTFDLCGHGVRTGGGELVQTVDYQASAVAPEVTANEGWVFLGWDADFSCVTFNMTVRALYERAPLSIAEAVGGGLSWTTGGDVPWFAEWSESAHDGLHHVRSGAIGNKQTSDLSAVVQGAGTVSFWCRVSSEADGNEVYDGLSFLVDGESRTPNLLGGDIGWTNLTFEISGSGSHTLCWRYEKDKRDSAGEDCAWVDAVMWTPVGGNTDTVVDVGGGKSVTVPGAWLSERTQRAATDVAANGRKVWECYVLGLNPEDGSATNDFRITSFPLKADGTPDIEHIIFDPPQVRWNVPATYRVKGAANLSDTDWPEVTEGNKGLFRFFKVELVLP